MSPFSVYRGLMLMLLFCVHRRRDNILPLSYIFRFSILMYRLLYICLLSLCLVRVWEQYIKEVHEEERWNVEIVLYRASRMLGHGQGIDT